MGAQRQTSYYRNVNNNSGIFDYVIGAAEEQECKEAFLAYHFLHTAPAPPTAERARWPASRPGCARASASTSIFEVDDALAKLERLGLLQRQDGRLLVPPARQRARPTATGSGRVSSPREVRRGGMSFWRCGIFATLLHLVRNRSDVNALHQG